MHKFFYLKIVALKKSFYSFRNNFANKKLIFDLLYYNLEGILLSERKEAIKLEIELMEKEILYFIGKKRVRARRAYRRLLKSCGETCALTEPIYLKRSE